MIKIKGCYYKGIPCVVKDTKLTMGNLRLFIEYEHNGYTCYKWISEKNPLFKIGKGE